LRARLTLGLAAATALALAGGGAASATPMDDANFALLSRVCIDTHADPVAALAAGKADGLVLPAPNGADDLVASLHFEKAQVQGKLAGESIVMLIVGQKPTTVGGQPAVENLCAIATAAPDAAADIAYADWIAEPPATNVRDNPFFVFEGQPGAHKSAAALSQAEATAAIHSGDMQTAAILHMQDATVLVYGKFVP
jgi:hypothetical protein